MRQNNRPVIFREISDGSQRTSFWGKSIVRATVKPDADNWSDDVGRMLSQRKVTGNRSRYQAAGGLIGSVMIRRKGEAATKRRIEINIDRQRLFVLKRRGVAVAEWCEHCGQRVQMLTPDQARILRVSSRAGRPCHILNLGHYP